MNFKLLETLKATNYSDDEIVSLINSSYSFFCKKCLSLLADIKEDTNKQKIFSNLVRFYRSINTNKKIEDGALLSNLKDIFKNYSTAPIDALNEKVNEIISIQTKRHNYSDKISRVPFSLSNKKIDSNLVMAIKTYRNISFRINVIVMNKDCNRVLTPEIILTFTFDDGEKISMQIDIKVFQDLRRVLAYHIKKMIDNESNNFLRN